MSDNNKVIYRRYRPRRFSDVVGQEVVIKTLSASILSDKIAHSYLLCGPRGTGKTSIARVFAKTINCAARDKDSACLACESCGEIEKGIAPDVIEVDAASNRGVDEIRELRESAKFLPVKNKYKVYIIDEAHMLTREAFNALLKILEEPPDSVIFILATTEQHKLPTTIISRTQRFNLRYLSAEEIDKHIAYIVEEEGAKIDDDARSLIVASSGGSLRDAQSVLGKVLAVGASDAISVREVLGMADSASIASFVESVLSKDKKNAFDILNSALYEGADAEKFIQSVLGYLRIMLAAKMDKESALKMASYMSDEEAKIAIGQADSASHKELFAFTKEVLDASGAAKYSPIPQLPLELAIMELTKEE